MNPSFYALRFLAEGIFIGALFAGLLGFLLIMIGVLNGREQ